MPAPTTAPGTAPAIAAMAASALGVRRVTSIAQQAAGDQRLRLAEAVLDAPHRQDRNDRRERHDRGGFRVS